MLEDVGAELGVVLDEDREEDRGEPGGITDPARQRGLGDFLPFPPVEESGRAGATLGPLDSPEGIGDRLAERHLGVRFTDGTAGRGTGKIF